jgi:hypothetical protein
MFSNKSFIKSIITCIFSFSVLCIINVVTHEPILSSFPTLIAVLIGFGIAGRIIEKKGSKSTKR